METIKPVARFKWMHAFFHKASMLRCILLSILIWVVMPSSISAKELSILVVNQTDKKFSQNLIGHLKSNIYQKNNGIEITKISINTQPSTHLISTFDLIITLGNKPAEYILNKQTDRPVLSLLITKRAIALLKKTYDPIHPWTTIALDQPINRQLLLIKYLLGEHKTIGTIIGPATKNEKESILKSANKLGLKLNHEDITITDQLISALKNLTSNSDVVLAIPDPVAFNRNTIRGILLLTYRKNIPVIGFSESYVKAGALAATYSSPEQISTQAIEIINSLINNNQFSSQNLLPKYFSIGIKNKISRTMGIKNIKNSRLIELITQEEGLK